MKKANAPAGTCPLCGAPFKERPAVSRDDPSVLICSECGTRQALASIGLDPEEQEAVLEVIHRHRSTGLTN